MRKLIQYCIPQHFISRLAGQLSHCPISWIKNQWIRWFAQHYGVDMSQAENENLQSYAHFHDFFIRPLKANSRRICTDPKAIVSPVDGAFDQWGNIESHTLICAKGKPYTVNALLAEPDNSLFSSGKYMVLYLSPKDYHRVHMPATGKLIQTTYIPGTLFAVDPKVGIDQVFARNERLVALFDTEIGKMAIIMVGALIVGNIHTKWEENISVHPRKILKKGYQAQSIVLKKGEEMGYFSLGSTVILLFESPSLKWIENLVQTKPIQMGQPIAFV